MRVRVENYNAPLPLPIVRMGRIVINKRQYYKISQFTIKIFR